MAAKIEPVRVSKKDLQEERKNRRGYQFFPKGSCHLLHPLLSILDKKDNCKLFYELEHKLFNVYYENKQIITPEVNTVVEIITKHYGG